MSASAGSGQFSSQAAKKPHLLRGSGGIQAEVADIRDDLERDLSANAAIAVEEYTNPPAADPDAFKTSIASTVATNSYSGAALNGATGVGELSPPRNVTVSTAGATPADAPATATFTGLDIDDNVISEAVSVPQTATTAVGAKAFKKVTSIALTAGDGTGALLEFGFGSIIGLAKTLKARAGLSTLVMEIEAGVKVTTGTIAAASVGLPHGTYLPANTPNGTRDYAVYYEYDASLNT
jgi:hypothetical protein